MARRKFDWLSLDRKVTFDFENSYDQKLSDHDQIVVVKNCDQGVPVSYVRFGFDEPGTW